MTTLEQSRGEVLLNLVYDEVEQRMNPGQEECGACGGEGYTYDCFDGCCVDAESGCEECARPCVECRMHRLAFLKAVREEVIRSDDLELAIAWLKKIGRWRDSITPAQIAAAREAERAKLSAGK
jgi:hypothetical protein